ncbi:hypothetical protein ACFV0L_18920 [Streptosporangium canum]|uniref:hypothetical protein n=1 Tax=Streptosporangium canum TaxID=324952 RepID=UPI0036986211
MIAPVKVEDIVKARDGAYVVLRVREGGLLIKARHAATNTIWHLVPRAGTWVRL